VDRDILEFLLNPAAQQRDEVDGHLERTATARETRARGRNVEVSFLAKGLRPGVSLPEIGSWTSMLLGK